MGIPSSLAGVPLFSVGYSPAPDAVSLFSRTPATLAVIDRVCGVEAPNTNRYITWPNASDPGAWTDFAAYEGDGTDVGEYTINGYVGGPYWTPYTAPAYVGQAGGRSAPGDTWAGVLAAALAIPAEAWGWSEPAWLGEGAAGNPDRFPGKYEGFVQAASGTPRHRWSGRSYDAGPTGRPPSQATGSGYAYFDSYEGVWIVSAGVDWHGDGYDPNSPPSVTVTLTLDGSPNNLPAEAVVIEDWDGTGVSSINFTSGYTVPGTGTEDATVTVTIAAPVTATFTDSPPTGWGDVWGMTPGPTVPILYLVPSATGADFGTLEGPAAPWVQHVADTEVLFNPDLPATVARIDGDGVVVWGTPRGNGVLFDLPGGSVGEEISVRITYRECARRDWPGGWLLRWTYVSNPWDYPDAVGDVVPTWIYAAAAPAWAILDIVGVIAVTYERTVEPYVVAPPSIPAGTLCIATWESSDPESDALPGVYSLGFEAPPSPWALPVYGGQRVLRTG